MAFRNRIWSAGKLLVIGGALIITYLSFAIVSARIALRAREVRVPDLSGRNLAWATSALEELDLTLRLDDVRRRDTRVAAGDIAAQDPSPGVVARRGRSVRVWLSAGPRAANVPAVVGETQRTAELRLRREGIAESLVSEVRSNDRPAGIVIAQDPQAGSVVGAGPVRLLVSRGERASTFLMPDLIGVSGERAAGVLRAAGFRVAVVAQHPYPGVPPGVIIRQSPQSGFQIAPGQPISLEVSR